jgi:hypothetical protein
VIRGAVALAVTFATSTGRAAPSPAPIPAEAAAEVAIEAGDANLEPTRARSGVVLTAAIGGGLMVGFGIEDSVGRGGSASFRIGHVATSRIVLDVELDLVASLHRQAVTSDAATNSDTNLLVGAQYYANPSLWLRFAGGVGVYSARDVVLGTGAPGERTLVGPAALAALGIELARYKWAVLGIEASVLAMVNHEGVLVANGLDLSVAFD